MVDLRTDFKDDILDITENTQRKYRMITNDDGTVSFVDATVYTQVGDSFGAGDVNNMTSRLNIIRATLSAGNTQIVVSNALITTDSVLSFYTSVYGLNPSEVFVEDGSVTLTFDAQETDIEVGVRVDG